MTPKEQEALAAELARGRAKVMAEKAEAREAGSTEGWKEALDAAWRAMSEPYYGEGAENARARGIKFGREESCRRVSALRAQIRRPQPSPAPSPSKPVDRDAVLEEAAKALDAWADASTLDEEAADRARHFASVVRELKGEPGGPALHFEAARDSQASGRRHRPPARVGGEGGSRTDRVARGQPRSRRLAPQDAQVPEVPLTRLRPGRALSPMRFTPLATPQPHHQN